MLLFVFIYFFEKKRKLRMIFVRMFPASSIILARELAKETQTLFHLRSVGLRILPMPFVTFYGYMPVVQDTSTDEIKPAKSLPFHEPV
jgi:hypothetical protein